MEIGHYVNSPADERRNREEQRGNCHSGGSKIYWLVGVGFGLLCIIQAALNVSLRLQAVGCSNRSNNVSSSNFTMMSDQIRDLLQEREQPNQERDQLLQEKDKLNQDKDQLLQDKDQLAKEKKGLQANNRRLIEDKKMLNEKLIEQQNQIQELQTKKEMERNTPSCPQGWWRYMSNCYQRSSTTDTWQYARQDCERKGSHLVILNDEMEERVVCVFGGAVRMWMGLSGQKDMSTSWWTWTWTWVDGSPLVYCNWNHLQPSFGGNGCAYVNDISSWWNTWFLGTCQEQHYWMCEKELHTSST